MSFDTAKKQQRHERVGSAPLSGPASAAASTPQSAVLDLQLKAGNAATAEALGGASTQTPGPEVADGLRQMHQQNDLMFIQSALTLIDRAGNDVMAAASMLMMPEQYGAWTGVAMSAVGTLTGAEGLLDQADRVRENVASQGPAWVEGHQEAIGSKFLADRLGELRSKLLVWKPRLLAVAPMDIGTPYAVAGEMMSVTAMVRGGIHMKEASLRASRE